MLGAWNLWSWCGLVSLVPLPFLTGVASATVEALSGAWAALVKLSWVSPSDCPLYLPPSAAVDSGRWHPSPPGRQITLLRSLFAPFSLHVAQSHAVLEPVASASVAGGSYHGPLLELAAELPWCPGMSLCREDSRSPQLPPKAVACEGFPSFPFALASSHKIVSARYFSLFHCSESARGPVKTSRTCLILSWGLLSSEAVTGWGLATATAFAWFSALCAACSFTLCMQACLFQGAGQGSAVNPSSALSPPRSGLE